MPERNPPASEIAALDRNDAASQLCLECALCRQGLIHQDASLHPEEVPIAIRQGLRVIVPQPAEGPRFALPCAALEDSHCSVYEERVSTCRGYTCHLLQRFLHGELSFDRALARIKRARQLVSRTKSAREAAGRGPLGALADTVAAARTTETPDHRLDPEIRLDVGELLILIKREFRPRPERN